jgi:uncharacterized protein (DUF427 family)
MMAQSEHRILYERSPKRVRAVIGDKTVADSLAVGLLLETGSRPAYYFPRADVHADLIEPSDHRAQSSSKGEARYWHLTVGPRRIENAAWSYEAPPPALEAMRGAFAFAPDKVDHWYEEDEEVFGHPRDPYHRVDARSSQRRVRVRVAGEVVADTRRAVFLFETGHPTRYYIPRADVRADLLTPTKRSTTCPYKGNASYWSITLGGRVIEDAVWAYLDPIPDCPQIKDLLCFYPEKVEAIEVEGAT